MFQVEFDNKKYHDRNLAIESHARGVRNAVGGVALAVYGCAYGVNDFVEKFIPTSALSSLASGALLGLAGGVVLFQHNKARKAHENAVLFAAIEVRQSSDYETQAADWALYRLQEEHTTAKQVLMTART